MAWTLSFCDDFENRKKDFQIRWRAEMMAIGQNLQTLLTALEEGTRPEQLKLLRFVRSEPMGILAISEKGTQKKGKPKVLRLYVFPEESNERLYVMSIGDKERQSEDIKRCKHFVAQLIQDGENPASGPTV